MKVRSHHLMFFLFSFTCSLAYNQVSISATAGSTSGNYSTLKGAFDKINDGTHRGSITIVIGNTANQIITETLEASLNKSGNGSANYTDILIIPGAQNVKVSSALSGACCVPTGTVKLNFAQNVVVDGRQGASGSVIDLTISNSSTNSYSSAFVFFAAVGNTLRYCNVNSSTTATVGGIGSISISDNNAGGGLGSSNNIVEYCVVGKEGSNIPRRAIASKGASTRENNSNIIRNNTITDFSEYGIYFGNGGSDGFNRGSVIEGNVIYQATVFATMSSNQIGICIGQPYNTGGGELGTFSVRNNIIGGNGAGGNWTCTTTNTSYRIAGISLNTLTTSYSTVEKNTIKNFNINLASTAADYGLFSGINVSNGKVYLLRNVVGEENNPGSITIARNTATLGGFITGIHVNSTSNISNRIIENSVSGFTITNGLSNFSQFYGIRNVSTTTYPTDSIYKNKVEYVLLAKVNYAYGISAQGFISRNRVRDFDFTGAATFSELKGIVWSGGHSTGTDNRGVENNEVILGKNRSGSSTAVNDIIYGIHVTRGDAKIFHNSVVIEGTHTGSDNTYALYIDWSGTIEVRNNALYNGRMGGTGKHYSISRAGAGVAFNTSNNAYVIGTNANNLMGIVAGTDKATLANWIATPISESASLFDNSANQPLATLFPLIAQDSLAIPQPSWLQAGVPSFVGIDIRNTLRDPAVPAIGAYEAIVGLPVKLLFFDGQSIQRKNYVEWATASENNSDYFEVERSKNAMDWEYLSTTLAAGNSSSLLYYEIIDDQPYQLSYYRLKQFDKDGKVTTYGPIALELAQESEISINVYPNPSSSYIIISLDGAEVTLQSAVLYNLEGRVVRTFDLSGTVSPLLNIEDLTSGIYVLGVETRKGTKTFRVVIVD